MNNYKDIIKLIDQISKQKYRKSLVDVALKYGISEAARQFNTTRKTVRKWVKRYEEGGYEALKNSNRSKRTSKVPAEVKEKIIETRKTYKSWGAYRIRVQMDLTHSLTTIHRILVEEGLIKKKKKKYQRRKDMSEIRKQYGPFEKIQVDIKYLTDIPEIALFLRWNNMPLYQITARDYRTGIQYICYCYEKTSTNCGIFIDYLCSHLKESGIDLSKVVFQTDNGKEFVSDSTKKMSLFEEIVTIKYGATHQRIPPGRPTYNSDVETVHKLIEDEFYCVEEFSSKKDFILKAFSYQIFFNRLRKNRNREDKTPLQILKDCGKGKWHNALDLFPIITDEALKNIV
ncbi:MAG: helix-turn-helix domain-containing protein, partial [Candidatus Cloacimonadia bacterium]